MAKTGIHFERCNCRSAEQHNEREKHYIDSVNASDKKTYDIFSDRTSTNTSWRNPHALYRGKSLPQILDDIRRMVKEKTGRKMQEADRKYIDRKTGMERTKAGASPIREGVCPVKEDTKIEDFVPLIDWLADHGVTVIRIDIHRDEGYENPDTHERKYNLHAHVIADWMNHDTGKSAKLDQIACKEMQTVIASALGMERGIENENRGHLKAEEMRQLNAVKDEKEQVLQEVQALRKESKRKKAGLTLMGWAGAVQDGIRSAKTVDAAKQSEAAAKAAAKTAQKQCDDTVKEYARKEADLKAKTAQVDEFISQKDTMLENARKSGYTEGYKARQPEIDQLNEKFRDYDSNVQQNALKTKFMHNLFASMQALENRGLSNAWRRLAASLADTYGVDRMRRTAKTFGFAYWQSINDTPTTERIIKAEKERAAAPQKSQGRGLR